MKDSDLTRFSEALLHLYEPGLTTDCFAARASAFLRELVPAEFVVLGALDRSSGQLDLFVDQPVTRFAEAMEALAYHMGDFELFNWDPETNAGRPFFRRDFLSERQFQATGIYADVYQPLGIDNHCAVLIPGVEREIAFFGIERKGGAEYSEEERNLLALAQSHLSNARSLALARNAYGHQGARPEALQSRGLTRREAEVLCWIAEGKSNDEIAMLLRLKLYTVKGYVKTIFQKIGAPNRLGAALWALRASHARLSPRDGASVRVRVKR